MIEAFMFHGISPLLCKLVNVDALFSICFFPAGVPVNVCLARKIS